MEERNCNTCEHSYVCKYRDYMLDTVEKCLEDISGQEDELKDINYRFSLTSLCNRYLSRQDVLDKITKASEN